MFTELQTSNTELGVKSRNLTNLSAEVWPVERNVIVVAADSVSSASDYVNELVNRFSIHSVRSRRAYEGKLW